MGCPPVRKIIHSLRLVDYFHVQADNPWYNLLTITYVLRAIRLIIISADVKGKDSMVLFKIKETAHFNSGHVLFYDLGSHVVALTQENVHDTLN